MQEGQKSPDMIMYVQMKFKMTSVAMETNLVSMGKFLFCFIIYLIEHPLNNGYISPVYVYIADPLN